ncbi:MAG: hypothetical protein IJ057_00615 [Bacteroidales bacterium]|nr:hypothetical protein [Bacteroidales bacterium]
MKNLLDFWRKSLVWVALSLVGTGLAASAGNGCKTAVADQPSDDSIPQAITKKIPTFPLEVLYVVAKEYEMAENGSSRKQAYKGKPIVSYTKDGYVELRLMELYPDLAYHGVAEESRRFYDSVTMAYASNAARLGVTETTDGVKETNPADEKDGMMGFVSEENEAEFLQMDDDETAMLGKYDLLARRRRNASLDEILSVAKQEDDLDSEDWEQLGFVCVVTNAPCSHLYYRILLCKKRAENTAKANFSRCSSGTQGDAFRHIAVSMLLRRYLTEALSYFIMDISHERIVSRNRFDCDTYMDLHNNFVGRSSKYWRFRGKYAADKYDWRLWLSRIKDYVDDDKSNASCMEWDCDTPKSTVKKQSKAANKNKYIYYDLETE